LKEVFEKHVDISKAIEDLHDAEFQKSLIYDIIVTGVFYGNNEPVANSKSIQQNMHNWRVIH